MARHAKCPSCGAAVEFKSTVSILAVCDYCQCTLLRSDDVIENLGKMASLVDDRSPLQRGSEGRMDGVHFGIVGRIQLKYSAGLWNEWHLLFDDGKSEWLSEAGGEYVLSRPTWTQDTLPAFADVKVGQQHLIDGKVYRVTNIENAECVAGEGELPFKVGAGYPAPVVDLRDSQGHFATLDYSDNPLKPLLFVGQPISFDKFGWSNLRENTPIPDITLKARAIVCPSCGAGLTVRSGEILSVGCASCGSVLDPTHDVVKKISQGSFKLKVNPLIAIGSKGRLHGEAIEIIGYMRRKMKADGVLYYWSEYVLLGQNGKILWLTESSGHWNLARVIDRSVNNNGSTARFNHITFKHFQTYDAFVDYVIGEFPWKVSIDETAEVIDFIAPPLMLSCEQTPNEETWTLGEYIDAAELEIAFGLNETNQTLPEPTGVFANQVNPKIASHQSVLRTFWKFLLAAIVIHFALLVAGPGGTILRDTINFDNSQDEPRVTPEFRLPEETRRLEIIHDTNLYNNWVNVNMTLVNKDTGESWQTNREISHYEGVDGGESWTEGSREDEIIFDNLPPGTYILAEEAEIDPSSRPVTSKLKINRAGPRWSSLLIELLVLALFPFSTFTQQRKFEVERWAESDHPMASGSDDDD